MKKIKEMKYMLKIYSALFFIFLTTNIQAQKVEVHDDLKLEMDTSKNICLENSFFKLTLKNGENYVFNFFDKVKNIPLLYKTNIYYTGQAPQGEFYNTESEEKWSPDEQSWEWSKDSKEVTLSLKSHNNDWDVNRLITLYADKPYLKLRYVLTAKESSERDTHSFPLMQLIPAFTSISYNLNDKFSQVAPIEKTSNAKLVPATIIQLFAPQYQRTLNVINNFNLPVESGYEFGSSFVCSDSKWCKSLSLNHSYIVKGDFLKKGQTRVAELLFFIQDGVDASLAKQQEAYKLARDFEFLPKPESLKFNNARAEYEKASPLARLISKDKTLQIWSESSLKKVFPQMSAPKSFDKNVKIFCAKNESESFQLVISPQTDLKLIKVSISDLRDGKKILEKDHINSYLLEYQDKTTVPGFYGLGSNKVADKLVNLKDTLPCNFLANTAQPLWFTVNIPSSAVAGLYRGKITLEFSNHKVVKVPIVLNVWNFALPQKYTYRAFGLLWDSPESRNMEYAKKMAEYHMTTDFTRKGKTKMFDGKQVNFDEFIKNANTTIREYHANTIYLPNVYLGNWSWKPGQKSLFRNMDPASEEFDAPFGSYLKQSAKILRDNGLIDNTFLYIWDEMMPLHYPTINKVVKIIRQADPGLKIMTVGAPDKEVLDNVDIICTGAFSAWWGKRAEKMVEENRSKGKEFWCYLNAETFTPDQPAVITRLVPWKCWSRGITGYLQWSMNSYWNSDFDSNGHVWLFYPSKGEPVASVRLEYFRDGIEDFEYFELLKSRNNGDQLLKEVLTVTPKFSSPDYDLVKIHNLRLKIGEVLAK